MAKRTFINEQEFNREVVRFLKERLENAGIKKVKVVGGYETDAPDNYLLRDFTFFKGKDEAWKLYAGAQEIDVIIYKETINRGKLLNDFVKTTGVGIRGSIIIPLVILELKRAMRRTSSKLSSIPSHDAIASNVIAGDIKRLFPKVKAGFLFDDFKGHSLSDESLSFRRMLYNFDFISLSWEQDKEKIWREIKITIETGDS